jgi:hypothetical protein
MKRWTYLSLAVAFGVSVACGQSAAEKQAEEMKKNAEEMQKSTEAMSKNAESMAKGFEAMAKGMAGAMGGTGDQKTVEPVDFRALQSILPEISGWEREKPTGEKMSMPVSFSTASARYTKGDANVETKITDSGFQQLLIAPFTMLLTAGYEKETGDGYEKSTTIAGYPALEKWTTDAKRGELTLFVNKRFLVEYDGSALADIKELRAFAEKTDLKKLADLK